MKINKIFAALCITSALCLTQSTAHSAPAQDSGTRQVETTLSADDIRYNVNTGDARAVGNVVIRREGSTLWGDEAEGNTNEEIMTIRGNVRGEFPEQGATMKSESAVWSGDKTKRTDGLIEAFGSVRLTRGETDYLNADYVRWEPGTQNYSARGNVDGLLQNKILKADEARRSGDKFWGTGVRRFEDLIEKYTIAARSVEGTLTKDPQTGQDTLNEMTAERDVVLDYIDNDGLKTRVTGDNAVYSKAHGTIVISGNTKAVRSDGKTVRADTMVVHEDTRLIEAKGNSQIIFVVDEGEPASANTAEGGQAEDIEEQPEAAQGGEGNPAPTPRRQSNVTEEELRWLRGN